MKKQIPLLLLALVVLLALWVVLGRREQARQRGEGPGRATTVDTLTVDRLVMIRQGQPTLAFEKDADGFWNMVEPLKDRANLNYLKQIERGLTVMEFVDRISSRANQHASFQVDDAQATRLQAYAKGELQADVYIGKGTPDRQNVYARTAGSDVVYSATGGSAMAALRNRRVEDYRNRDLFGVDISLYDSLEVTGGDFEDYRLTRVDTSSWQLQIGSGSREKAEAPVVEGLLRALGRMQASGFAPDSVDLSWDKPALTVRAWRMGPREDLLQFQKSGEENAVWLHIEGKPYDYKVWKSVYDTFNRNPVEYEARAEQAS